MAETHKITGLIPFLLTTDYDLYNAQFNWRSIYYFKIKSLPSIFNKFLAGFSQISQSFIILNGFYVMHVWTKKNAETDHGRPEGSRALRKWWDQQNLQIQTEKFGVAIK